MKHALAVVALLVASPALAGDAMQRARQAYEEMEYDAALTAAAAALADPKAGPAELVEAFRLRGLSFSALERMDEALEAFRAMLSIDPKATIAADTSPKQAAPFYQALAMARDMKPIALAHQVPPGRGRPAALKVLLASDPQALVKAVCLVHRDPGGEWQRSPAQPARAAKELAFSPPPGERVAYYFEALTAAGGVLARAGSADAPFAFEAPAPKPVTTAPRAEPAPVVADLAREDHEEPALAAPWYESWWFWTVVGAVVVGSAVGLGVGLGAGGDGSGARDYTIEVR